MRRGIGRGFTRNVGHCSMVTVGYHIVFIFLFDIYCIFNKYLSYIGESGSDKV